MPSMNTSDIEQRINELEYQLQFQEDTIDSLNKTIALQQRDLLLIQEKLSFLARQLENYRQQQTIHGDDKPPHY